MRIYLDTSVPSTYFDVRTLERQKITQEFWQKAIEDDDVTMYISTVVISEIQRTPTAKKRNDILELVEPLKKLTVGAEASDIAEAIIGANLVPQNKVEDAEHLAVAALHFIDVVVSWNYRHMVNLRTKQRLPLILAENGCFKRYEIITPIEYLGG